MKKEITKEEILEKINFILEDAEAILKSGENVHKHWYACCRMIGGLEYLIDRIKGE